MANFSLKELEGKTIESAVDYLDSIILVFNDGSKVLLEGRYNDSGCDTCGGYTSISIESADWYGK